MRQTGRNSIMEHLVKKNVPGPGTYQPKLNVGESIVFNSTYKSPTAKTFYHNDRFPQKEKRDSKKLNQT